MAGAAREPRGRERPLVRSNRRLRSGVDLAHLNPGHRVPQGIGATRKRLPFLPGHLRFEDLHDTLPPNNARQGNRDTIIRVVRTDWDHGALVAQHLSAMRADTMPIPNWLAWFPSIMAILA